MRFRPFALILLAASLPALLPSVAPAQQKTDCLSCHGDHTLTAERAGKRVSMFVDPSVAAASAHQKVACVACHAGLGAGHSHGRDKVAAVNCVRCHADAQFKHPFHPQVAIAINRRQPLKVSCQDCHGTHDISSPAVPGTKFHEGRLAESCGSCHRREADGYRASAHGKGFASTVRGAPNCLTCHRRPITFGGNAADSVRVKLAQAKLCLTCHLDDKSVKARTSPTAGFVSQWEHGIHGAALATGNAKAANCVSCHTSHEMRHLADPASQVNRANILATCATCHGDVTKHFRQSAHGVALARGDVTAPVCSSCHGEHAGAPPQDLPADASPKMVAAAACLRCHQPVVLSAKYVITSDQFRKFADSNHGFTARGRSVTASNCASCHSGHDARDPKDPSSNVNRANLNTACGSCHSRAGERFASGPVHEPAPIKK